MTTQDEADSIYRQINMNESSPHDSEEQLLKKAIIRLNGHILGLVLGITGAVIIFVATNWLVFKGGDVVGPHLSLLGQFFIGYSVTFAGSLIGAVYGFIIGYLSGLLIGWIYNAVIFLKRQKSAGK
jgi:hypothetical protein